jgi:hypothetical protein
MTERTMAEYPEPHRLAAAIRTLRARGYRRLRAFAPYAVPEVEEALELPTSSLPIAVFAAGAFGTSAAYFAQWLLNAYLYPLDVGGRPPHFPLAYVPITFEMAVLSAALTGFFGVLVLGRLVKLWEPVFETEGFESATEGSFWLEVLPDRDSEAIQRDLADTGATRVVRLEGRAGP